MQIPVNSLLERSLFGQITTTLYSIPFTKSVKLSQCPPSHLEAQYVPADKHFVTPFDVKT